MSVRSANRAIAQRKVFFPSFFSLHDSGGGALGSLCSTLELILLLWTLLHAYAMILPL